MTHYKCLQFEYNYICSAQMFYSYINTPWEREILRPVRSGSYDTNICDVTSFHWKIDSLTVKPLGTISNVHREKLYKRGNSSKVESLQPFKIDLNALYRKFFREVICDFWHCVYAGIWYLRWFSESKFS